QRNARAVGHGLRLAVKGHAASLHRAEVPPAVIGRQCEEWFASALFPDQRALVGRPGELQIDGHIRRIGWTDEKPPVVAQPVVLRHDEAESIDEKPESLILIVDEQREHSEAHRHGLLFAGGCGSGAMRPLWPSALRAS